MSTFFEFEGRSVSGEEFSASPAPTREAQALFGYTLFYLSGIGTPILEAISYAAKVVPNVRLLYLAYRLMEAVRTGGVTRYGDLNEKSAKSIDADALERGDFDPEAFLESIEAGPSVLAEELSYHLDFLDPRFGEIVLELESTAELERAGELFEDFAPGTIDAFEDALAGNSDLAAYVSIIRQEVENFRRELEENDEDDELST